MNFNGKQTAARVMLGKEAWGTATTVGAINVLASRTFVADLLI